MIFTLLCDIQYNIDGGGSVEITHDNLALNAIVQELRRGTITLAVLSQLKQPQYGYSLVVLMNEKGFNIEANTLYPLLRRLENQEILDSFWDTDGAKPRKYYKLSEFGKDVYSKLCVAWNEINNGLDYLVNEEASR